MTFPTSLTTYDDIETLVSVIKAKIKSEHPNLVFHVTEDDDLLSVTYIDGNVKPSDLGNLIEKYTSFFKDNISDARVSIVQYFGSENVDCIIHKLLTAYPELNEDDLVKEKTSIKDDVDAYDIYLRRNEEPHGFSESIEEFANQ